MNICFDNIDWRSTAGPHWFGRKLAGHLDQNGHGINTGSDDVQLSIVMASQKVEGLPLIQRLDGIYYDTAKDYVLMNAVDTYLNQPINNDKELDLFFDETMFRLIN